MPPLSTKKSEGTGALRKDVEFVAKDADEQVAVGIVMVPDKVDLQADFAREETIRAFADQFADFEEVGQADGGVMHAVWPDDHINLERNEVLDEARDIGDKTAPAGAWVQGWKFEDDQLWSLVEDGVLAGYSIGAVDVQWSGPFEQDELDDVAVPDAIDEEEFVWEIVDGIVREVSAVDIPAVPDAEILETKAAAEKRMQEHLGNRDAFIEEALERGHSEAEAERLWEYLNDAVDVEGAGEPGEKTMYQRIGKAVVGALWPDSDSDPTPPSKSASDEPENPDEPEEQSEKHDAGDDTPDEGGSATEAAADMSDDNSNETGEEDKSLAEKNAEQISELTAAVEDLTETMSGPEVKTAEIEIGGETYEVREEAAKAALGVDEETSVADAIERLNDEVEMAQNRIDAINRQSGGSGQVDAAAAAAENGGEDEDDGLANIGKALS